MDFEQLYKTQGYVTQFLRNSYQKNRIVHSYLFEGAKGTNKLTAAYFLAMMILCKEDDAPCMMCNDCRRIMKNVHPNVTVIEPLGEAIKKEQIEALQHDFYLTSLEANKRVYIINHVDKLTASGANSLLKFLEEPNEQIYGILITENLQSVIRTIISRTQVVSFEQLSKEKLVSSLVSRGIEKEMAQILSGITNDENEIMVLAKDENVLKLIDLVKQVGLAFVLNEDHPLLVLHKEGKFLLEEKNKTFHYIFLDLLTVFFNDLMYYKLHVTDKVTFIDTIIHVGGYVEGNLIHIIDRIDKILKYKQRLNYNVNIELLYAQMIADLMR